MVFVIHDENGIVVDNDLDNDGVCDDDEVLGCTDSRQHVIMLEMKILQPILIILYVHM